VVVALVVLPLVAALVAFAVPSDRARPWILPATGAAHLALAIRAVLGDSASMSEGAFEGWLLLGALGKVILPFTSVFFFLVSIYTVGYLRERTERQNRIFCASMLTFLGMMTLIVEAHHLGLMWVALEASTLSSAPLILFNRDARALEALWKYLIVGSVGVALALFGSFFLAYSALRSGLEPTLLLEDLVGDAPRLSKPWLHSAFILLFIGYGTKMGLAPMHTWKPDAYGEAPGVVGALLAGCMTNCSFLAILRFHQVCIAAGDAQFTRSIMITAGIFSMAVAGVFMAKQRDFKRMLAYSSVEHMGILVLGVGIAGTASFGAMLHLLNNGFTKGVLFLSAGNIHRAFGSKVTGEVRGALRRVPASAALFVAGFFAITATPPFGPFFSELTIIRGALTTGHYAVGAAFLVILFVVFVGMGATVLSVTQGDPPSAPAKSGYRDNVLTIAPIAAFLGLVLLLGVYLPPPVDALLRDAAGYLEAP
jgi:hydrogenase-4 component F